MNLTLLCPTYNRHHFLERNCKYWANSHIQVIYSDGSELPFNGPSIKATNISYIHRPVSMYQRFSEMVSLVQTPYVCIMGDDEYFIPSALLECCTFLDCNQDFVSCMGRAEFSSYKDRVIFTNIYEHLRDRTSSATDPFTRLKNHFSSYVPSHTYAVTRLDVFKKAIHEASSSELDIFAIKELIHEFTVSSLGKSLYFPLFISCAVLMFHPCAIQNFH